MSSVAKNPFLPSLLDRLTNEEVISHKLIELKQKIKHIEDGLNSLANTHENCDEAGVDELKKNQKRLLQNELTDLLVQQTTLKESISAKQDVRECVRRDLERLLNTIQYVPNEELNDFPEIKKSVLNYGIPDLIGRTASELDLLQLQRVLTQVILDFEPRILPKTLVIRIVPDQDQKQQNAFSFEIEGQICAEPAPLHMHLRSEFELEDNQVKIYDVK